MQKDIENIFKLDSIGNAPYFSAGIVRELKRQLSTFKNIKVVEDEFAVFVKVGNEDLPPLLVDSHLDHPGFVIGTDNLVHSLGSFTRSKMIHKINFPDRLPVNFYTDKGLLLTTGYLFNIKVTDPLISAHYFAKNFSELPPNTQVFPDLNTQQKGDFLHLRSVDNLASVFVCLSLIKNLESSKDCNLTFIFQKLEEIYQFTATGIAKRGNTPFEKINPNTPIIVLDVGPVLTKEQDKRGDLCIANTENNFNMLNSSSQLLSTINSASEKLGIKIHFGSLKSHGDAISYNLVGKSNESICLLINSYNRHNIDEKGNFVPESVRLNSILNTVKLLKEVSKNLAKSAPSKNTKPKSLTELENAKRKQLLSSFLRAYPRLKYQKLYPKSLIEFLSFSYYSLLARLVK